MIRTLLATRPDPAPLLARLVLGAVMLPHGAQHALGWFGGYGFAGTLAWMTDTLGFPTARAAPAIAVELVAPLDSSWAWADGSPASASPRSWPAPPPATHPTASS